MKVETVYLVIGADRQVRVAKRPRIAINEIAFRVRISYDDSWGKVIGDIDITAPEFKPAAIVEMQAPA